MTEYIVSATLTVSGDTADKAKIQSAVDSGLAELPGLAARFGFTVTETRATVEERAS